MFDQSANLGSEMLSQYDYNGFLALRFKGGQTHTLHRR